MNDKKIQSNCMYLHGDKFTKEFFIFYITMKVVKLDYKRLNK